MRLQISKKVNASDWDTKICLIGGSIFHSSIWADYIVATFPNTVPQFITLLSNNGELLGAALGFQNYSKHKLIARWTKRLWFDAMPVVRNNDKNALRQFLQLLHNYAYNSGCIELLVGSYASHKGSSELKELGFKLTKRLEFELQLEHSEHELWRRMAHKRRKNIKKAIRMGVTIHDLPIEKGIYELRRLQAETAKRILERGGPDLTPKVQYAQDPVRILVESDFGRIVGASIDGTVVSASLFTCFNGLIYHLLSGHSQRAFETQAPTLLLWEKIKQYRNEGAKKFNLGGCKADAINEDSPEHGVYVYKKAFGSQCWQCVTGKKILRKTNYKIINMAKDILGR